MLAAPSLQLDTLLLATKGGDAAMYRAESPRLMQSNLVDATLSTCTQPVHTEAGASKAANTPRLLHTTPQLLPAC